ncbi:MAG TPA: hemerythrin domain-containing protein [Candidatus Acidoferrum sp.]|jgi:hemerythrin-like domain-containing protein|nr:hemerythrin domain-containing protein [Candidatus Acidoferrum sp.]
MLRDKNLIPLSHQHQKALALCVRIERAQPIPDSDLEAWQTEIEQHFEQEIKFHFSAEEEALFPAARQFPELVPLVEELIADHAALRESFSQAEGRCMSTETLPVFARQLSAHIRKEERQLFERLQQLMTPADLGDLGTELAAVLKDAAQSCILPNEATKLRSQRYKPR